MRVLMFGWEFPPHITGGLGTACYGMTKALSKTGTEVIFVVPKLYGDENSRFVNLVDAESVEVDFRQRIYEHCEHLLSYIEVNSTLIPYCGVDDFYRTSRTEKQQKKENIYSRFYSFSGTYGNNLLEEVLRYALIARTIATSHTFDVIHAHDWLTYHAGIEAKRVSGKPLVIHVHATEFDRSGEHVNQNIYDTERYGMDMADKIVAVSDFTRNTIIERYGQPPDKVVTVYNGVESLTDADRMKLIPPFSKLVSFLGRVTFQKGPDYFVEAADKLLKKDPNVHFVMAGSGDMLRQMVSLVAKKRISANFHFTGFLNPEEVEYLFAQSDVYVMPSVSEPFGISPLEALRAGIPVVISKQSGVAEILNHVIKVDFWDTDAIANAIYAILHYTPLKELLVNHSRQEIEHICWEDTADKLNKVYADMRR